jgi:iron complex outermembrane receptor protein
MRLRHTLTALLYGLCWFSQSRAEALYSLDIPAGELTTALDILAHQTHAEFIYSADEVRGVKTHGVQGNVSAETAVERLLEGTQLVVKVHPSGAILISRGPDSFQPSPATGALAGQGPDSKPLDSKASDLREVVIIGTRRGSSQVGSAAGTSGIGIVDSAAPVEIVGAAALTQVGQRDLTQGLLQTVPSFNYSSMSGDTGNLMSYVRLRGLSPNDTLVLINGKRRHGTANLVVDGRPFQGAAGADLSLIPLEAIDHIEVLTDEAAAQYGTDAIAGVINIVLKHNSEGGLVTATGGQYFDQQGNTGDASVNVGLAPLPNSFLNVTAEIKAHGHSDLVGLDPQLYNHDGYDNLALYPNVVKLPGYPYIDGGFGDAAYRMALLTYNSGFDIDDSVQLYSFGTAGYRNAQQIQNYRLPNKIPALWPFGFSPVEALKETDFAVTAGVKGTLFGDWNFDLGSTYGSDNDSIYVDDSANIALYDNTGSTPTDFYVGGFVATQWTTTLDLNRNFNVGMSGPLNLALGVEDRHESYEIHAGDPASRYEDGSQSYSGFTPTDAGYHARSNQAVYVDLALTPVRSLQLDVAGRFEHYSDFGDARVGKLTARYDFRPDIALRGTISNGFRAPTLAEEHYSATNITPTSGFVQLASNSPGARLIGIDGLRPETSVNYSLGLVAHPLPDLVATLDAYQIRISDRIVGSGNIFGSGNPGGPDSPAAIAAIQANGNVLDPTVTQTGVNVFNNGADTRTRGVDLAVTRAHNLGAWGRIDWSFSASYDSTLVTQVLTPPHQIQPQTLLNETALSLLSKASPNYRLILGALWEKDRWSLNLRELIYGQSSEDIEGDDGRFYSVHVNATPITNLILSYAPINAVKFSLGADNVFNTRPNRENPDLIRTYILANDGAGTYVYPNFSPYGVNGGYYYARANLRF